MTTEFMGSVLCNNLASVMGGQLSVATNCLSSFAGRGRWTDNLLLDSCSRNTAAEPERVFRIFKLLHSKLLQNFGSPPMTHDTVVENLCFRG